MSTSTEQQLRELFAAEAATAPEAAGLADGAVRKVRHRHRVQVGWLAGASTVVVAASVLAVGGLARQPQNPPTAASRSAAPSQLAGEAVPGTSAASCVEAYSLAAVAKRRFAFDGTVISVGPAKSNRPGYGVLPLAGVTFHVNHWFRGGSGDTVTVDLDPPTAGVSPSQQANTAEETPPAYQVGTRLLVSGEPRWDGPPLDAAIAWSCGFTRYYSPEVAAAWVAATS